jgi:uridine kinase
MNKPYIVGITGGSASGKTLFLKKLIESFPAQQLCVVSQDDYYKLKEHQPIDLNGIENYDTPDSIDLDLFVKDLHDLRSGNQVIKTEYTFNKPGIIPQQLIFKPAPILVVEGIFIFYHPEILNLLDLKIFIDAKEHIKIKRRISRDQVERGDNIEAVLYRYENHVNPTFENFILPYKDHADIIIPNNTDFTKALNVITGFLKAKIGI